MNKKRLYPFDLLVLGYMAFLTVAILLFGRPLGDYADELLINLMVIVIVLSVIRFLHSPKSGPELFLRLLYPAILFLLFYKQTGGLMNLIFPEFLDYQLTAFEKSLFGVNPTLWLDSNMIHVWLTELLSLLYFAYYPLIYIFLLTLFFKKEYHLIKISVTAICMTFFVSFPLFFLYPIEGPRYFFAGMYTNELTGPFFHPLVELAQRGAVHGGCMPSTHFGVALVIMFLCLKYYKKAGIMLIPVVIGLALGTFYDRYHYVSDVIVGGVIGLAALFVTLRFIKFDEDDISLRNKNRKKISYVS